MLEQMAVNDAVTVVEVVTILVAVVNAKKKRRGISFGAEKPDCITNGTKTGRVRSGTLSIPPVSSTLLKEVLTVLRLQDNTLN